MMIILQSKPASDNYRYVSAGTQRKINVETTPTLFYVVCLQRKTTLFLRQLGPHLRVHYVEIEPIAR